MTKPILSVRDLRVELKTRQGSAPVIDGLSFDLAEGETLGLVGESGCGKSMTALAIMGLLPQGVGRVTGGSIMFGGEDLTKIGEAAYREIRGNRISMIFQEPMTSLNPVWTIGEQIAEVVRRHKRLDNSKAVEESKRLLDRVGIPNNRIKDYPHQLSGGQRQRVMIAIALACSPNILVADEPTTALDVTVQAKIFELLKELGCETKTAIILITHDMGAVAQMASRMIVMYAGRKAEEGKVSEILRSPNHPYTKGLVLCVPRLTKKATEERPPLTEIDGIVPSLEEFGSPTCLFESRCPKAEDKCRSERPEERDMGGGHISACRLAEEIRRESNER